LILQAVKSFEKTVLTPLNNTDGKDLYGWKNVNLTFACEPQFTTAYHSMCNRLVPASLQETQQAQQKGAGATIRWDCVPGWILCDQNLIPMVLPEFPKDF
jgi:hypothetical protein